MPLSSDYLDGWRRLVKTWNGTMQNPVTWEKGDAKAPALPAGRAYVLAAVCVGAAFLLRLGFDPVWKDRLPYGCFFLAVIVVAQFAEAGPSVFAVVGGFVLAAWFFVAPRHTFLISNPIDQINTVLYFVLCCVVLYFTRRTRRAQARERAAKAALGRVAAIIESSDDAIIGKSLDGKIVSWNAGAGKLYGYTEAEAVGQPLTMLMDPERATEWAALLERMGQGGRISNLETTRRRKDGAKVEVSLSISQVRNSAGQIVGVSTIARDIAERKRAEREREHLVEELQKVLSEVKTLSGLLPICAHCKKIRDDKGYWNQIELYIRDHSSANFTHSVCPECSSRHYGVKMGDQPQAP
jgi:PAS domain S-box-containing protein